jgi:hypothetical protein
MKVRSRFSNFRDKFQVFLLGLLFGLVLGGGFFVLKLDQYVKELSFYKSLTQSNDQSQDDITTLNTEPEQKPKTKKPKKAATVVVSNDSTQTISSDTSSTAILDNDGNQDGIVVRKDELMGQKVFPVQPVSTDVADTLKKDQPGTVSLLVEFWKSPLNYRGYKYSRNKMVLFGMESADVEGIYHENNSTYLKAANVVYRMDLTNDFHQFERISDENIINSLK